MVNPIDYTMDVLSPIEGYMQGLKFGEGIQTDRLNRELAQSQEGRAQETFAMAQQDRASSIASAQAAQQNAAAAQAALVDYVNKLEAGTATPAELRAAMLKFPKMAETFQAFSSSVTSERLNTEITFAKQLAFALRRNPDQAKLLLETRAAAAEASGDQRASDVARAQIIQIDQNPSAVLTQALMPLVTTMTPEDFDKFHTQVLGIGGGDADGPLQIRSSKILEDGTIVALTDGGPVVYSPSGEVVTGQAAADAVVEANEYGVEIQTARSGGRTTGQLEVKADLGAEVAGATEAGKLGIQLSGKIFENLGPLYSNISNLNRAIELVKEEGANTGILASKLPALDAATIELRNLRSQLGLDVIGAVTFGALSKGELNLALNVALPDNLTEDKLVGWLERKRDAQQKVINNLTMQAQFLGTPGRTPDKWIEFTRSGGETMSDMLSWMSENPIGGRIERVSPADPAAPAVAVSDDQAFVEQMTAKVNNGERLTQAETTRLNIIARGSQ